MSGRGRAKPTGRGRGSNQNQSNPPGQRNNPRRGPHAGPSSGRDPQKGQGKANPAVKVKQPSSKPTAPQRKGSGSKQKDEKKAKGAQPMDGNEAGKQALHERLKVETREKEEAQQRHRDAEVEILQLRQKIKQETKAKEEAQQKQTKLEYEKQKLQEKLNKETKDAQRKQEELDDEMQKSQEKLNKETEEAQKKQKVLEDENKSLQEKLNNATKEKEEVESRYRKVKDEKVELEKEKYELSDKLTEEQTNHRNWKRKYETLKEENQSLEQERKKALKKANDEELTIQEKYKDLKQKYWELNDKYEALTQEGASRSKVPRMQDVWIIPRALYEDDRVMPILKQVLDAIDHNIGLQAMEPEHITTKHQGRVLVPLVAASRLGSDVQAAYEKAKLGNVPAIMLIFHHLAPHNSKITTKTKDRLSDRELVERSQDMIDLVFWNGAMYDCAANHNALTRLKAIAKETFS